MDKAEFEKGDVVYYDKLDCLGIVEGFRFHFVIVECFGCGFLAFPHQLTLISKSDFA